MSWLLLLLTGVFLALGSYWYVSRENSTDSVIEVKKTPRRVVEEMTVDEFGDLSRKYLLDHGYEFREEDDQSFAVRNGNNYHVKYDPGADSEDPRAVNQMVVNIKKSDMDGGILITSGEIQGKAATLAERADIKILDPDTLVSWKRQNSGDNQDDHNSE